MLVVFPSADLPLWVIGEDDNLQAAGKQRSVEQVMLNQALWTNHSWDSMTEILKMYQLALMSFFFCFSFLVLQHKIGYTVSRTQTGLFLGFPKSEPCKPLLKEMKKAGFVI